MGPLIMIAAQLLAGQMQKQQERRRLQEQLAMERARRLGGDTIGASTAQSMRDINGSAIQYAPAVLSMFGHDEGGNKDPAPYSDKALSGGFSPAGQAATGVSIDSSDPYSKPLFKDDFYSDSDLKHEDLLRKGRW